MCEYVDLMLEGVVCEECGSPLGEALGYPRKCPVCAGREGEGDEGDAWAPGDLFDCGEAERGSFGLPASGQSKESIE